MNKLDLLLEIYIKEMLDIGEYTLPGPVDAEVEKSMNKGLEKSIEPLLGSIETISKYLGNKVYEISEKYYNKFLSFKNSPREELGIDDDLEDLSEKFLTTFYPEVQRSFMIGFVEAYVLDFKKGFNKRKSERGNNPSFSGVGEDRPDFDSSMEKDEDKKYEFLGYKYFEENCINEKGYYLDIDWDENLEKIVTSYAIKEWDKYSSNFGGLGVTAKHFLKEMGPKKFWNIVNYFFKKHGYVKGFFLSALQSALFVSCWAFMLKAAKLAAIAKTIGLGFAGMKLRFIIKLVIRNIQAYIISLGDEGKDYISALNELSLFENLDTKSIPKTSDTYLARYEKETGYKLNPTGRGISKEKKNKSLKDSFTNLFSNKKSTN